MKLHTTAVDKLLHVFETYGGHRNNSRLREVLNDLLFAEYVRTEGKNAGEKILVLQEDLERETEQAVKPTR